MLRRIGCDAIADNLLPLAPPISLSVARAAREAGNGFELVFFQILQEEIDDLRDERLTSALALVHSRFSTNTFPSWPLAHPYRVIAHNGEINTVMGNRNWMRAREGAFESADFGDRLERAYPIMTPDASDTASCDSPTFSPRSMKYS